MKVIITGGGTGGHVYPAIAIANGIKEANPAAQLLYIGTQNGLEAKVAPAEGIPFETITVESLPRVFGVRLIKSAIKLVGGLYQAYHLIKRFKPDVIISTGGYVAGPTGWVGTQCNIPLLIHEQNAVPGLTNRILAKRAALICLTFSESAKIFKDRSKLRITGLPVRKEILIASREKGLKTLGLDSKKKTILITGGSLGAYSINEVMIKVIPRIMQESTWQIIFITGERGYDHVKQSLIAAGLSLEHSKNLIVKSYMHDMENALAVADLVVGRAGAAFLAEITALGIPAVLIPYPHAADNHQEHNARALVDRGAAVMIKDDQVEEGLMYSTIEEILHNDYKRNEMSHASKEMGRHDALQRVIEALYETLERVD